MSRVEFFTKEGLEVGGGWDPPLRYFFVTIFSGTDVVADVNAPTTGPLKELLAKHGISPPEGFWERVELKEGGVIHRWSDEKGFWFKR